MIYVTLYSRVKVILNKFTFIDDDATANNYIDAIWTTWVVSMGENRNRVFVILCSGI